MDRGGNTYYYQYDGLGSVTEVTDGTGAVVESYTYDAYGNPGVTSSLIGNPYMFTGRRWDGESETYFYRNRNYDPYIGAFIQRDPLGYQDSMHLYSYVTNSPINWTDPYGLQGIGIGPVGGPTIGPVGPVGGGGGIICPLPQNPVMNSSAADDPVPDDPTPDDPTPEEPGSKEKNSGDKEDAQDDYPTDPDDWDPPEGWQEVSTGKPDRHRHWRGPNGKWRRWDREGRPGGKDRGQHWHDSDRPGEHIAPTR